MNLVEEAQRRRIAELARGWIGTPYHHHGMVRGVGVDCATIIQATFIEAGLIPNVPLPPYSPQWHMHRDEQLYLDYIRRFADEVPGPEERTPLPGDVIVWFFHRAYAHGGIVVAWPRIVHSFVGIGVNEDDAEMTMWLRTVSERTPLEGQPRPRKILSYWDKKVAVPTADPQAIG